MKIWLLKTLEGCGYDQYDGMVIRAETPQGARKLADGKAGSHGREAGRWTDAKRSSCVGIAADVDGKAEIILASFRAG